MPRQSLELPPVEYLSILDADGHLDAKLDPKIPAEDLKRLYRTFLLARRFDERMLRLQRQGRIGTFGPTKGHEAAVLGSAFALRATDWVVPYYREWPAYMWRGWPLDNLVLYYAGFSEGMRVPDGNRDLPLCIPIASQCPHAVGVAYAARYKGEDSVVLAYLGDGATSHGDFQEAANFAGVFQVPLVFFVLNNQWAISVPRSKQTRAKTLAQKATAWGFPGVQVDGNDLLACYVATREAVERARQGKGPTLVEAVTYRLSMHTTADDPTKYRSEDEVKAWEAKEPLPRFRRYLEQKGLLDEPTQAAMEAEVDTQIREAIERAEARMQPTLLDAFEHVYAERPASLETQRQEWARYLEETGQLTQS
ncbi:MAG TPA: pyruvate dehydrogenase (acetyl-transferring) E1 component subunit alpha [Methylomirabilota bacterium]|jgi:pyruvate dehydrogenase E1 component alpha subunit|nr:pyruvate dehydrogenase (acetyl-transferring) E1 component subunit alpha [Methylomirabilota bacterium]